MIIDLDVDVTGDAFSVFDTFCWDILLVVLGSLGWRKANQKYKHTSIIVPKNVPYIIFFTYTFIINLSYA